MNRRPNILLLFPDEHRGDWIPKNESLPLKMPNLEKIMDNGTTFENAITPSPLCAPARACLASGCSYDTCGVPDNSVDYPLDKMTFYRKLRNSGYQVGGVGKFDLHKPTHFWGLDGWIDDLGRLGFTTAVDNAGKIDAVVSARDVPKDPYMNILEQHGMREYHIADMINREKKTHPTRLPKELYCDNWLTANGINMLKRFQNKNPWFLQVNFTGPHPPFDVTYDMKKKWENTEFPNPIALEQDSEEAQAIRQNYAAMLENIDECSGKIIEYLKETKQFDNTLIIYTSDHGEMLGDYNYYGKCRPENASIHIPFIVSGPGVQKGRRSQALVELQDLAATFCDYAGIEETEFEDSMSIRPILESVEEREHRNYQKSALYQTEDNKDTDFRCNGWRCVLDKQFKLVEWDHSKKVYYSRWDDRLEVKERRNLEKLL